MGKKKEYWELLQDPRWQKKRLEVMKKADFKCESCECDSSTLNVHHCYYEKGKMPWEYPLSSLKCLCEDCHENIQRSTKEYCKIIGVLHGDIVIEDVMRSLFKCLLKFKNRCSDGVIMELFLGNPMWHFIIREDVNIDTFAKSIRGSFKKQEFINLTLEMVKICKQILNNNEQMLNKSEVEKEIEN